MLGAIFFSIHVPISSKKSNKSCYSHSKITTSVCKVQQDIFHVLFWNTHKITCFSDRSSCIDYMLITNLMHWFLFIHKILFSSKCFEPQVLIFRRIQLYICSIWQCHSSWWPVGAKLEFSLKLCTDRPPGILT